MVLSSRNSSKRWKENYESVNSDYFFLSQGKSDEIPELIYLWPFPYSKRFSPIYSSYILAGIFSAIFCRLTHALYVWLRCSGTFPELIAAALKRVNMVYFNSKYNNVSNLTASRAITDYAITETTIFCNSKYNNVSKVTASRAISDYAITETTATLNTTMSRR
jgi:hypothetical protein